MSNALVILNMESRTFSTETYIFNSLNKASWKKPFEDECGYSTKMCWNVGQVRSEHNALENNISCKDKFKKIFERKWPDVINVVGIIDNDQIDTNVKKENICSSFKSLTTTIKSWCTKSQLKRVRFCLVMLPRGCTIEYILNCAINTNAITNISNHDHLSDLAKFLKCSNKSETKKKFNAWGNDILSEFLTRLPNINERGMIKNIKNNISQDFVYKNQIKKMNEEWEIDVSSYELVFSGKEMTKNG